MRKLLDLISEVFYGIIIVQPSKHTIHSRETLCVFVLFCRCILHPLRGRLRRHHQASFLPENDAIYTPHGDDYAIVLSAVSRITLMQFTPLTGTVTICCVHLRLFIVDAIYTPHGDDYPNSFESLHTAFHNAIYTPHGDGYASFLRIVPGVLGNFHPPHGAEKRCINFSDTAFFLLAFMQSAPSKK